MEWRNWILNYKVFPQLKSYCFDYQTPKPHIAMEPELDTHIKHLCGFLLFFSRVANPAPHLFKTYITSIYLYISLNKSLDL